MTHNTQSWPPSQSEADELGNIDIRVQQVGTNIFRVSKLRDSPEALAAIQAYVDKRIKEAVEAERKRNNYGTTIGRTSTSR